MRDAKRGRIEWAGARRPALTTGLGAVREGLYTEFLSDLDQISIGRSKIQNPTVH